MKIQEKKTSKGTNFAIIKFSDYTSVYELFVFSEILEKNRKNFIEGKSFLITVLKDKHNQDNRFKRISVRKIVNIMEIINHEYEEVCIELDMSENIKKLSNLIKEKGNSKIKILINDKTKKFLFELKDKRKFDYDTFKILKKEHFVRKINI